MPHNEPWHKRRKNDGTAHPWGRPACGSAPTVMPSDKRMTPAEQRQAQVDADVEAFLAAGGKITKV